MEHCTAGVCDFFLFFFFVGTSTFVMSDRPSYHDDIFFFCQRIFLLHIGSIGEKHGGGTHLCLGILAAKECELISMMLSTWSDGGKETTR